MRMLPEATSSDSLYYILETGQEVELDALVVFDRYAFVIEGKAGSGIHATNVGSFKARLGEIVGAASTQALRALTYLQKSKVPQFRNRDGVVMEIDKSRTTSFIPVTVSLDSLDVFTSELGELRAILKIPDVLWAVCLTDLREISEIISRPSEFTHYIQWRLSVGKGENVVGDRDEMNWLGVYLKNGPTPPTPPSGFDMLKFTSHTEDFDNFFMHKLGDRERPADRPSQHLPKPLPAFLDAIERSGMPGFTAVAEALLDCTFGERDSLAELLGQFAFLSSKDRAHTITFEAARWIFFVSPARSDLLDPYAIIGGERDKPAIVIMAAARNGWIVSGWHIEPPRKMM